MARNELDTDADTSCAGANWALLEYTGEICEVSPFLTTYDPIQEIPVARCCTVWTSDQTGIDYLLVGDQMLWFGTLLPNSLLNPNQIRAFGLEVFDNPFNDQEFGIDGLTLSSPSIPRGRLCTSTRVFRLDGRRHIFQAFV